MEIRINKVLFTKLDRKKIEGDFVFKFEFNNQDYFVFYNDEYNYVTTLWNQMYYEVEDDDELLAKYSEALLQFDKKQNAGLIQLETESNEIEEGQLIFRFDIEETEIVILSVDDLIYIYYDDNDQLKPLASDEIEVIKPIIKQFIENEAPGWEIVF